MRKALNTGDAAGASNLHNQIAFQDDFRITVKAIKYLLMLNFRFKCHDDVDCLMT